MVVNEKKGWVLCENCGKKLLKRKPNGVFVFKFGRNHEQRDVVHIEVMGSMKVKCFRSSCEHMNVIQFFPDSFKMEQTG